MSNLTGSWTSVTKAGVQEVNEILLAPATYIAFIEVGVWPIGP